MHFGILKTTERLHGSSYHLQPQLGRHRQCSQAICTFHLGFSLVDANASVHGAQEEIDSAMEDLQREFKKFSKTFNFKI